MPLAMSGMRWRKVISGQAKSFMQGGKKRMYGLISDYNRHVESLLDKTPAIVGGNLSSGGAVK